MKENIKAIQILILNTWAFTVCFACWMLNGVLVTFLIEHQVFAWSDVQVGWLLGIPVLSGSLLRLPVGILTDKYGGKPVYTGVMLGAALPMFLLSQARDYLTFFLASLGFGIAGTSFAVGIAYTSVWFPQRWQGTALGIFGAGNAGAALTSLFAPRVLNWLTHGGENVEAWRLLPQIYALILTITALLFYFLTYSRKVDDSHIENLAQRLAPLKEVRVWRYGLYYFLVFGGFVALSQWLIPYYLNVYSMSLAQAGMMASIFSFPSGVIRALGGWLSDHFGARKVMYAVLGSCAIFSFLLIVPRMEIVSPGKGVLAKRGGIVTSVSPEIVVVDDRTYPLIKDTRVQESGSAHNDRLLIFPTVSSFQEPLVGVGDKVVRRQLLARGMTHIYFQANVWVFTLFVFIIGFMMGIGKAAVYKFIPEYFPRDVGAVGGVVGLLGGLGGFLCPILFGYLLEFTGIWTSCWIFLFLVSAISLWWLHRTVQKMMHQEAPRLMRQIETVPIKGYASISEINTFRDIG